MKSAGMVVAVLALGAWGAAQSSNPMIYVTAESTQSSHWAVAGGSSAVVGGGSSQVDPQRDELIKTMIARCPAVSVTLDQSKADFVLDMQREPNKGYLRKRNKWVLSSRSGAVVDAGSDRTVGDVAKDACAAVTKAGSSKQR